MTELQILVPPILDAALAERVSRGGYLDASEYVRDLLRRDLAVEIEDRRWLKAMIDEGLASGVVEADIDEVFDAIIAEDPDLRG